MIVLSQDPILTQRGLPNKKWRSLFLANRVGKGTHCALDRCQQFAPRYPYVLQFDVEQFFPAIDHNHSLRLQKLQEKALEGIDVDPIRQCHIRPPRPPAGGISGFVSCPPSGEFGRGAAGKLHPRQIDNFPLLAHTYA